MSALSEFVPPGARRIMGCTRWSALAHRTWAAGVAVVVVGSLVGCGTAAAPAAAVGNEFYRAVGGADWSAACALLAPETKAELEQSAGKACAAALADEALPDPGPEGRSVEYGTMTQVRYRQDTVFLARFQSGWRVMAAGCSAVPGHPYDCRLQGG